MIPHPILDSYANHATDYDEYHDASGTIRPIWQSITDRLRQLQPAEFERRNQLLRRLITENGITYNVYSDAEMSRQWGMDLLPLVFSKTEWQRIEAGLRQRAELIHQCLKDLYGPQEALLHGILPPHLVYANPAFLRPCHGIEPVGGDWVNLYAADIARSPDGNWWILNDRIEAASGMGYVLENRLLSNRLFPELFREQPIKRLHPFYDGFNECISNLHPASERGQRVALLTPGPANETFFEQSFLSKNLGFQLVEGADLTVRDNTLFYKTLKGIVPIRNLLRRLDSDWCDPLELRNESLLGVPGLLQCLRSGQLSMMNGLGTGLMETVAMPAFMENLCQFHRSESLLLPSVATWWCGQPAEFSYVMQHLQELVIKPTFRQHSESAVFGPALSKSELRALRERIERTPERYCAQQIVSRATAPAYHDGQLHPHHFLIRVYLTRMNGQFHMMPGGLARIAPTPGSQNVSMQHGAISKDVWILDESRKGSRAATLPRQLAESTLPPIEDNLSSRTANNLYWFGRYIERVECLARQLHILMQTLTEDVHNATLANLHAFLSVLLSEEELQSLQATESTREQLTVLDALLTRCVSDPNHPNSLASDLNHVRRIAFHLKDRLSTDSWQILSHLQQISTDTPGAKGASILHEHSMDVLDHTLDSLAAFSGKTAENMVRTLGWQFLMLGKRLERSYQLIDLLRSSLIENPNPEEEHLQLLLQYADSTITYRNRHLNAIDPIRVFTLLLKDAGNPRSLTFMVEHIIQHLGKLPWRTQSGESHNESSQRLSVQLIEAMSRLNAETLIRCKAADPFNPITSALDELHLLIEQRFFANT